MHGQVTLHPDSVIISGPQEIIDSINVYRTRNTTFKHIKDTIIHVVELESMKRISLKPEKVMVIVPVVKYTEMEFNIPIEAENVPDSLFLRTFPGSITLSCWVGLKEYNTISPFMFRAMVDYKNIESHCHKLKVNLVKMPDNINNVNFNPKSVEYLIEK